MPATKFRQRLIQVAKLLALPLVGMGLLFAAFVYDVVFAGIPYQDPTPAMTARYDFHRAVATGIAGVGLLVVAVGLVVAAIGIFRAARQSGR